jgi:hypothetical protein
MDPVDEPATVDYRRPRHDDPRSDRDPADIVRRRLGYRPTGFSQQLDMGRDRRACVALNLLAIVSRSRASRKVRHVSPPAIAVSLVDRPVLSHRIASIPLARLIED